MNKTVYICQNCGAHAPKLLGRCPQCGVVLFLLLFQLFSIGCSNNYMVDFFVYNRSNDTISVSADTNANDVVISPYECKLIFVDNSKNVCSPIIIPYLKIKSNNGRQGLIYDIDTCSLDCYEYSMILKNKIAVKRQSWIYNHINLLK